MKRHPLILFTLLLAISGWMLWARRPLTPPVAASEPRAQAQTSPPATPTITPTPLPPMPTPDVTVVVEADWQTYSSPYAGISFRYPPGWSIEAPEERSVNHPQTEAQRLQSLIGSPIYLRPPDGKLGSIVIILNAYTLSPTGALAEWVLRYNEWSGLNAMGGFSPIELATIPADRLPPSIAQGLYSVNARIYSPSRTLWVERNGFVYSISTGYGRPEDIALSLAVIRTMSFDAGIDATLRAADVFHGDEETLRQQLIDAQPDPTPECDTACRDENEYIARVVAPAATAKALPPLERPTPQPYSPLPVGEDWVTYTQPVMGISFRHPPGMSVFDPFKERNLDDTEALRWGIALTPTDGDGDRVFTMVILPYLRGQDTPLSNWEAIYDQSARAGRRDYNFNFPYRAITYIDPIYFPLQADDMIMVNGVILISADHVIYQVGLITPATRALGEAILSTLEFDTAQLAKLKSLDLFQGDEQQIVAEMVQKWATPTPYVPPTPTPTTPAVRATVTPSAFESPLINGLRQYYGNSSDDAHTPYRVLFDPDRWQWLVNEQGTNYLGHQHLIGCALTPGHGAYYAMPSLAPVELAGREWNISYHSTGNELATALQYSVGWDGGYFRATLSLSEPLPAPYDPDNKSHCQLDAETVLDTFTYTAIPPTPTNTPTMTPTRSPIVRATVTPPAVESPLVNGLRSYQGHYVNPGYPDFEVLYDPQAWGLAVDEKGKEYLLHQSIQSCEIMMQTYLTYHVGMPPVTLGGVEWRVSYPTNTEREYLAYTRDWEQYEYTFFVALPTPIPRIYAPDDKGQCQLDAEAVIATFSLTNVPPTQDVDMPVPTVTPTAVSTSAASQVPPRTPTPAP